MSIGVVCPQCSQTYEVADERAGQTGRCTCGATMAVPGLPGEPSPPRRPEAFRVPSRPAAAGPSSPPPAASVPDLRQCARCGALLIPGVAECPSCAAARHRAVDVRSSASPQRPFDISLLVVLCDVGGLFGLICSAVSLLNLSPLAGAGATLRCAGDAGAGLGYLIVGCFLWKGYRWARVVLNALVALTILSWGVSILGSPFAHGYNHLAVVIVALLLCISVVVCVWFLFILNGAQAKAYCVR